MMKLFRCCFTPNVQKHGKKLDATPSGSGSTQTARPTGDGEVLKRHLKRGEQLAGKAVQFTGATTGGPLARTSADEALTKQAEQEFQELAAALAAEKRNPSVTSTVNRIKNALS